MKRATESAVESPASATKKAAAEVAVPKESRALVKENTGKGYTLKLVPTPTPKADEVLIRVEMAALCGSDVLMYNWYPREMAEAIAKIPFVPGHEGCGIVVAVGSNVTRVKVGQRVAADTHIACETCFQCTHDQKHICQRMGLYGHNYPGCLAEYSTIPENATYVLKTPLSAKYASIMEPFGVAYRCVEEVRVPSDTLLVIGVGPIGLAAVAIAKYFGAGKILCLDVSDDRLRTAVTVGAHATLNTAGLDAARIHQWVLEHTGGDGVGNIIEASGAPPMVNTMSAWIRKGGYVCMVGLPKAPIHVENPLPNFIFKELNVKTIHGRKIWATWEALEPLLWERKINIDPILTHTVTLDDIDRAFAMMADGTACKVQVRISGTDE